MGTSPGLTANVPFIHCFFPGTAVIQEDDKLQHLIIISAKTTWNNASEIKGYRKDGKCGECTFNTSFYCSSRIKFSLLYNFYEVRANLTTPTTTGGPVCQQSLWLGCAAQTLNRSSPRLIAGAGLAFQKTYSIYSSILNCTSESLSRGLGCSSNCSPSNAFKNGGKKKKKR